LSVNIGATPLANVRSFVSDTSPTDEGRYRARFYFDVWEDVRFIEDRDGIEFPDLDAAEHEATETAAEISHDLLPKGTGHLVTVELRNELECAPVGGQGHAAVLIRGWVC